MNKKSAATAKKGSAPAVRRPVRAVRELAHVQSASYELTRDINRDSLLERIRALQPVSRVDLARASGLQPSTVSSIVEQLLRERWIREGAAIETARGRRPTHLVLNDDIVILVADVHPAQAVLAVVDVNGRFLSRKVVPLGSDPQQGVRSLAAGMRELQNDCPGKTFEGVGLAMPGRIDPQSHQLILAPNLRWKDYDIRSALAAEMGLRVELENAANACLLSELWFGHIDGIHDAVLVTIAEGVGAAILADGRLVCGRRGLAGEFGHICVDPAGVLCGCGLTGCWEMYASSAAAVRYYSELDADAGKVTISELAGRAMNGDAPAVQALERQAVAIGRGLRMITAALSPDLILLAGDITSFWELSKETIKREYQAGLLTNAGAEIVPLGDGELALLRGAAAVVLQRHTGYYRAAHSRDKAEAV